MNKQYTVIAMYDDTREILVIRTTAPDPDAAYANVASEDKEDGYLTLIVVLDGHIPKDAAHTYQSQGLVVSSSAVLG